MKTLRIGVLGGGFMGRRHAANLSALPGVTLAAIADTNLSVAREIATAHGGAARACDSFEALLDAGPLDAVVIALPPFAHSGQVEAAAARGLGVFVEKPIALDPTRASAMATAVRAAGVPSQVGYHLRFLPSIRRLEALVASGEAGRPLLFQGLYRCNSLHAAWWRDRSKSGGQVLEQAIHTYNLALHLLGGRPSTVSGFAENLAHREVPGYTIEDTSAATIRFENGAVASICATNCAVPGEWVGDFTAVFERLAFFFRHDRPAEIVFTGAEPVRRETVADNLDPYAAEMAAFAAVLRGKAAPSCTIEEGLRDVRVADALYASARRGGAPVSP